LTNASTRGAVAETTDGSPFRQPRIDFYLAAATTLGALVLYALTVQPTVSFWDCGEFIAAAAILGVPHPPGTPLFVILGRLFSLLPTASDIGLRINLLSVVSSAFAVGMAYLAAARLERRFIFRGAAFWGREWVIFVAAVCSAILFGFATTVWSNAVEAEVYGITLFLFAALLYVTTVWFDHTDDALGQRLLIFASFTAVLGLGVHMMVFLAIPGFWIAVFATNASYRRDWRLWVSALVTMLIMVTGVEAFLWNVVFWLGLCAWWTFASRPQVRKLRGMAAVIWAIVLYLLTELFLPLSMFRGGWSSFDWLGTLIVFGASLVGGFISADEEPRRALLRWGLCATIAGAALTAFTIQAYLPVRSTQDPILDENNPETWTAFKSFLERKQYGRTSMVERMFHRRGEWKNQLGRHPRMGFWSFFEKQWGLKSGPVDPDRPDETGTLPPVFLLLFILGLLGVGYLGAVHWRIGIPILLTLLLATIGLVIYMNFADGTHYNPRAADQAYLEVRDRDYFFTTGFALFGFCIGLGVGAFLRLFHEPRSKLWKAVVIISSAVFLFALPVKTITANYWQNDRSRNFIPYDYAFNMLSSCEQNGILFTYGDNDTFPLWCLQYAYRFRPDVRLINLSLANMAWYVLQVKNEIGAPFDMSDEMIERMTPNSRDGRIQDQVVNIVMESNKWKDPVYFGMSVPEGVRVYRGAPLDSNLEVTGMTAKVVRKSGYRMVDRKLTMHLYRDVFQFRGVNDSTIHKDQATRRIVDNYVSGILFVADSYRRENMPDSAIALAAYAAWLRPRLLSPRVYIAQVAGENGLRPVLDSLVATVQENDKAEIYYNYALSAEIAGKIATAEPAYRDALRVDPSNTQSFQRLASMLYQANEFDSLLTVIDQWIAANPADTTGPMLRREIVRRLQQPPPSDSTPERP